MHNVHMESMDESKLKPFSKGRRADDEKGQIESTVREDNEEGGSAEPNCAN